MNNNTVELIKIGGLALGGILLGYITKKLYDRKSTKSTDHFFVGIDLGATNAKAGVVNDKGELLATASHPLTDYTDKGVVKALVEVASEAVKEAGLEWKQITEIGVGSPGTIDFDVYTDYLCLYIEWCCYQGFKFPYLGSCSFS